MTMLQNARMNKTLYALTVATICMMPFQCLTGTKTQREVVEFDGSLTGLFGMNFKNMPELEWDHGYLMFWCIAGLQITLAGEGGGGRECERVTSRSLYFDLLPEKGTQRACDSTGRTAACRRGWKVRETDKRADVFLLQPRPMSSFSWC